MPRSEETVTEVRFAPQDDRRPNDNTLSSIPPIPPPPSAHLQNKPEVVSLVSSSCGRSLDTTTHATVVTARDLISREVSSDLPNNDNSNNNSNSNNNNNSKNTKITGQQHLSRIPEEVVLVPSTISPNESISSLSWNHRRHRRTAAAAGLAAATALSGAPLTATATASNNTKRPITIPMPCSRKRRRSDWEERTNHHQGFPAAATATKQRQECLTATEATNVATNAEEACPSAVPLSLPLDPSLDSKPSNQSHSTTNNKNENKGNNDARLVAPLSVSIRKAVRRRVQYMIRGTRLVQKQLPPIVIGSSGYTNTAHRLLDEESPPREHDDHRKKFPIVSVVLPPNTPRVCKSTPLEELPPTNNVYLKTHALLGKGAFATVVSVTIEDSPPYFGADGNDIQEDGVDDAKPCCHYYACKFIKEKLLGRAVTARGRSGDRSAALTEADRKHRRAYVQAESQLIYEAHLLGSLKHYNIIKLNGFFPIRSSQLSSSSSRNNDVMTTTTTTVFPERSVLLTEVLDETLAQKLSKWREIRQTENRQQDAAAAVAPGLGRRKRNLEKLAICQQLADALEHVHSHNIVYRDLKPENVGFAGSTLKLFDFGLSREMTMLQASETSAPKPQHEQKENSNTIDARNSSVSSRQQTPPQSPSLLQGTIGTMRYMAPEVCLEEHYGCECDLYSYAVLCWEIWTHKNPYATLTPASYKEMVCLGGLRPHQVDAMQRQPPGCERPSHAVQKLLEKGWVRDPKSRISWKGIRHELFRILQHGEA
jgi:serine/threonine protein kinase